MVKKGSGSIVWNKKLPAGILIYGLLLVAVFSLLVTVYVEGHLFQERLYQSYYKREQAYALAVFCRDQLKESTKKGKLQFQEGEVAYQLEGQEIKVHVTLTDQSQFDFTLHCLSHS